jgi:hypothetical protein
MEGWLAQVEALLTQEVLIGLGVFSVVGMVGTVVALPFILVRLPPHYFDERHPRIWMKDHHPVLRTVGLILKNLVGAALVLVGIPMVPLPGPGWVTILLGLSLLDFPGKHYLERKIIGQPLVLRAINAHRAKHNRPPLTVTPDP